MATSIALSKKDWSEKHQRVKKRNKLHERYNLILDAYDKKALKMIVNNFLHEETTLTLSQFKNNIVSVVQLEGSFTDYIMNYLNENKSRLRLESWWSYKSQITKLLKFKKKYLLPT